MAALFAVFSFAAPAWAFECHQVDGDIICTDDDQTDDWATASGGGADWNIREVSPGDRWIGATSDPQHDFVDADRCLNNGDSLTYSLYHSYVADPLGYVYSNQDQNITCTPYTPPIILDFDPTAANGALSSVADGALDIFWDSAGNVLLIVASVGITFALFYLIYRLLKRRR